MGHGTAKLSACNPVALQGLIARLYGRSNSLPSVVSVSLNGVLCLWGTNLRRLLVFR